MGEIWFSSDHHLWHDNILGFKSRDGAHLRDFDTVEEMNETIIERHNELVKPGDKAYFLGDFTFRYGTALTDVVTRMNGKKRLLLGNHDRLKGTILDRYFEKVALWRVFGTEGFVCSHVPLNPTSFPHSTVLNVHGHVHRNTLADRRFMNVSVEVTDYRPVHLEEVLARVREVSVD